MSRAGPARPVIYRLTRGGTTTTPIEPVPGTEAAAAEVVAARRGRGILKMILRIGIGAAVLAFLVAREDSDRLIDALGAARPGYLALGLGAIVVGLFVSALRWRVYLRALDLDLPLGTLFRLYFVGTFFNAFLPTGIGGDAYKALRVAKRPGQTSLSPAFATVFLDRFAGVVALSILGFGATSALFITGDRHPATVLALALAGGIVAAALLVLIGGDRLAGVFVPDRGIGSRIRRLVRAIEQGGRMRGTLAPGLAFGLLFQLLVLGYHLALARAVGIEAGVAEMASIVVISSLATMIPVTINGLGFRETAYTWALGQWGFGTDPQQVAFALLVLGVLLTSSALGGIVYVVAGGEIDHDRAMVGSRATTGE